MRFMPFRNTFRSKVNGIALWGFELTDGMVRTHGRHGLEIILLQRYISLLLCLTLPLSLSLCLSHSLSIDLSIYLPHSTDTYLSTSLSLSLSLPLSTKLRSFNWHYYYYYYYLRIFLFLPFLFLFFHSPNEKMSLPWVLKLFTLIKILFRRTN